MISLSQHLEQQGAPDRLRKLFAILAEAVKDIADVIETGQMTGYSGTENVFGEQQLKLDVATNDLLVERLKSSPLVATLASEELDDEVLCSADGSFSVAFDPLDGSSLVDVNFSVGSIFGIYPGKGFIGRTPREQVASAIAVYGPRTVLFVTIGKGVHEYTLRGNDFFLTAQDLKVAHDGAYFAPGNLRVAEKTPSYQKLLHYWLGNKYTLRYSGGMVPDVSHILKKGKGIFAYPGSDDAPSGKLRLLFECGPMGLLMEQAGGFASDGTAAILDQKITSIDQRTPIFIGSSREVERALEFYAL